jgi:hypothetical protein
MHKTPLIGTKQFIASPNIFTKLSPSLSLTKSPCLSKRHLMNLKEEKINYLLKYASSNIQENLLEEDSYMDTEEDVRASFIPTLKKINLFQEINKTLMQDDSIRPNFLIKKDSG